MQDTAQSSFPQRFPQLSLRAMHYPDPVCLSNAEEQVNSTLARLTFRKAHRERSDHRKLKPVFRAVECVYAVKTVTKPALMVCGESGLVRPPPWHQAVEEKPKISNSGIPIATSRFASGEAGGVL